MSTPSILDLTFYGLGLRVIEAPETERRLNRLHRQDRRKTAQELLRFLAHSIEQNWRRLHELVQIPDDLLLFSNEPLEVIRVIAGPTAPPGEQDARVSHACQKLQNLICLTAEVRDVPQGSHWLQIARTLAQIKAYDLDARLADRKLIEQLVDLGVTSADLLPELCGFGGEPSERFFGRRENEVWCRLEKGHENLIAKAQAMFAKRGGPVPSDAQVQAAGEIRWNGKAGTLTLDGEVIRRVNSRAVNVIELLDKFQDSRWPESIPNPWQQDIDAQKASNTVKTLNRRLEKIVFHVREDQILYSSGNL